MRRSVHSVINSILGGLLVLAGIASSPPLGTPPTISPIANQITQRDSVLGPLAFTVGDPVVPPDSLKLTGYSSDTVLVPNQNIVFGGSGTDRTVTVTPALHKTGTDSIIITVSDGFLVARDTFTVKVNSPPFLDYNLPLNVLEGGAGTITPSLLHAIDNDNSSSQIIYTVGPDSGNGQLLLHGTVFVNKTPLTWGGTFTQDDIDNNRVTVTHDASEASTDFFTFSLKDSDGGISSDNGHTVFHFNLSITDIHDPPVAFDTTYTIGLGAILKARFHGVSPDTSVTIFSIVTNGTLGSAKLDSISTGDFTYIPSGSVTGTDSITFQVYDGTFYAVNPGKVRIHILQLPPLVTNAHFVTSENSAFDDTLHATDPNVPPLPLYYSITSNGVKGAAVLLDSASGRFQYTPKSGIFGVDTFKFRARAGIILSDEGLVEISIRPAFIPGRILLADNYSKVLILVDPVSGSRAVITSGDSLLDPRDVVVEPNGTIFVLDGRSGIIKVEQLTGMQTQLTPGTSFTTDPIGPSSMAMVNNGDLLVADGTAGIKRIDRVTGSVSVMSSGDSLNLAVGVAVDKSGNVYAGDASVFFGQMSKLIRINPLSGVQSVVSEGGNLALPVGIAIDDSNRIFVSDPASFTGAPQDYLMRIDSMTGAQTVIATSETLKIPTGLDVLPDGNLVVANNHGATVYSVNPGTGKTVTIASGGNISQPFGLTVIRPEPLLASSEQSIHFGFVHVGSHAIDSIFVLNSGAAPLTISSVISDSAEFTVKPGSATIQPSSGIEFYVTFSPTSTDSISSRIVFMSNAFDSPFILIAAGSGTITSVRNEGGLMPSVYALYNNYPNPFNPSTMLRFDLPQASTIALKVYNILGEEVADLTRDGVYQAGRYSVLFNAGRLASGVYFYELYARGIDGRRSGYHSVKKMTLLR